MNHPFNGTQLQLLGRQPQREHLVRARLRLVDHGLRGHLPAGRPAAAQRPVLLARISYQETQAYTSSTLSNLNEVQTASLHHFGGGNEVQSVTFGPGFSATASSFQVNIGGKTPPSSAPAAWPTARQHPERRSTRSPGFAGTVTVTACCRRRPRRLHRHLQRRLGRQRTCRTWASTTSAAADASARSTRPTTVARTTRSPSTYGGNTRRRVHQRLDVLRGREPQAALQGTSEVQAVTLSGYTHQRRLVHARLQRHDSVPVVRGQNNTTTGIAAAIAGGNEQQQVVLTRSTARPSPSRSSGTVKRPACSGFGGTAISSASVAAAINGLAQLAGRCNRLRQRSRQHRLHRDVRRDPGEPGRLAGLDRQLHAAPAPARCARTRVARPASSGCPGQP